MQRIKAVKIATTAAMVVLYITVGAYFAAATVSGGKHDLSANPANVGASQWTYIAPDDGTEVCVFCHTPHAANVNTVYTNNPNSTSATGTGNRSLGGKFLWNRALPAQQFSLYTSATMNATNNMEPAASAGAGGPGTMSLLCLSCHDGVGAFNVLINYKGVPATFTPDSLSQNQFGDSGSFEPGGRYNIGNASGCDGSDACPTGGTDLTNDHPIGIYYEDSYTADSGGFYSYASLPAEIQKRLNLSVVGGKHSLECSTCHDPHKTNIRAAYSDATHNNNFLIAVTDRGTGVLKQLNDGSVLCLGCHNK